MSQILGSSNPDPIMSMGYSTLQDPKHPVHKCILSVEDATTASAMVHVL